MSKAIPFLFFLVLSGAELRAQVPYYQGKTITFIVRSGAGTAYDMYGRLLDFALFYPVPVRIASSLLPPMGNL